jgi:multidrug efflux pump subunit AcrB
MHFSVELFIGQLRQMMALTLSAVGSWSMMRIVMLEKIVRVSVEMGEILEAALRMVLVKLAFTILSMTLSLVDVHSDSCLYRGLLWT